MAALASPPRGGYDRKNPWRLALGVMAELDKKGAAPVSASLLISASDEETDREDQPALELVAEGGTQIVWEDRWHEEEIFANRLSFYLLAQSFLVFAAVEATLSSDAASRWLPLALIIDLAGLILTVVFWYALTENLRRLDALKEIVAEGSAEAGIRGYREVGEIRTAHHARRSQRALPFPLSILLKWSPSWWLAHGIPALLGSMWIALISAAVVTAARTSGTG